MKSSSPSRLTSKPGTEESTSSKPSPKRQTHSLPQVKPNSGSTSEINDPSILRFSPSHSPSPTITECNKLMADPTIGSVESIPTEPLTTTSGNLALKSLMPLENGLSTISSNSTSLTEIYSGLKRATTPKTTGSSMTSIPSISLEGHVLPHHGFSLGETEPREMKISLQG